MQFLIYLNLFLERYLFYSNKYLHELIKLHNIEKQYVELVNEKLF